MGASSTSSTQRSSIHKRTQLNYANEYERGLAVNVTELRTSMSKRSKWLFDVILIGLLSISVSMFGEPMPQNLAAQTQTPASDDAQRSQQTNSNSSDGNLTSTTQSNTTSSAQTNQQAPNQPSPPPNPPDPCQQAPPARRLLLPRELPRRDWLALRSLQQSNGIIALC